MPETTRHIPDFLLQKRADIYRLAAKHGIGNIRIFGSHVRGEQKENSDVDMLVSIEDDRSYFDVIHFKRDFEELTGKEADIVVEGGLSVHFGPYILKEALPL